MDVNADLNGNFCCDFELSLVVCNGVRTGERQRSSKLLKNKTK